MSGNDYEDGDEGCNHDWVLEKDFTGHGWGVGVSYKIYRCRKCGAEEERDRSESGF